MAFFTTSDGVQLYYKEYKQGDTPILCLSGLTRNHSDFGYMLPFFPHEWLICPDYRGRGRSQWAADPLSYSVPREAQDVLELLDHLGLERVAVLGTSRGGLIAMALAVMAPERLLGVALNDIGPVVEPAGLAMIESYLGRPPVWKTHAEAAAARGALMSGFQDVPESRWREEVEKLYEQHPDGLGLRYDPALREGVFGSGETPAADLWPYFDALPPRPLACLRGESSNILSAATLAEMQRRRPDMIAATIPGRGHIPFLDEPESVAALRAWMERIAK